MNTAQAASRRNEARWKAVLNRQPTDGDRFFYAVSTTGIYCRPGCPSREPKRENVQFFESCEQAESAGFRACLRCRPKDGESASPATAAVIAGCRFIETAVSPPSLQEIADAAGYSPQHFQKIFYAMIGITPKDYSVMTRIKRFSCMLRSAPTVADAIYGAGYHSSSRCYAESMSVLGMTPDRYRKGGSGQTIQFGVCECSLGQVLVGTTADGICQIAIGSDPKELASKLQDLFPNSVAVESDQDFTAILKAVVRLVDGELPRQAFPLDIRGTAFQREVWQALQQLPAGKTVTYSELAESIGRSAAVRAVASACGANQLAIAIPCHRVIRADGGMGGFRWGIERKRVLLERETTKEGNSLTE
ncbi:MAG: bifunctional DNA-binding transcriptional regulator/O6-methylguanine-DNA methyltransferase Ada [Rubripirellula sp.]